MRRMITSMTHTIRQTLICGDMLPILIHPECSSAIRPILVVIMIIGEQFAHCRQYVCAQLI